ncbi:MAG: MFS transporter, partial [Acidimicrobiales bacterium]
MGRARADNRLRWLLSSSAVSNLGDGVGKVAFPLLATTLTHDPVLIAGLAAVQFLPWLLFAVVAGALVDRVDRRRAMVVANVARAAVGGSVAVLVAAGTVSIWLVYVAALLLGTAETVADSAANALIPAVVGDHDLEGANSKLQACEIVGQTFLGGPVGSTAFALFATFPFLLNSAGFAIAAVVLLGLGGSYRPK